MLNKYTIFWGCMLLGLGIPNVAKCQETPSTGPLFEALSPDHTGIHFINRLEEGPGNNILESEFFYNGGGIAVGDLNSDGLPDIYFTANQGENALYLNLGEFKFKNVTQIAGLRDSGGWSAGTVMADVNADGLLDIYVCKAGDLDEEQRKNKLFINNGVSPINGQIPTFTERAAQYGVDDPGYCTQGTFFDYNRDGLLDLFIVNYNTRYLSGFDVRTIRNKRDPLAGDKLYRNNGNGTFSDVSEKAGILQNPIGFGLSATVSDLNSDGWPDIYVANDYMERDYMYINQGDGTFKDEILVRTDVISYFSMGSDIADIDNNGFPDILVVDMLPPEYQRRSVFKTPDYDIYDELARHGYHRQNMRNMLHLNNGDGTFTEVGQLAGVSMTDWSWSALMADFDNDGSKDVFITNGFPRFYTNLDYLNNILWKRFPNEKIPDDPNLKYKLVQQMEQVQMHNFAFRNAGKLPSGGHGFSFEDATEAWGLKSNSVSGAASFADFNNDGFLDLIVSNINEPPFLYKNRAGKNSSNNYLKVRLEGSKYNTFGTGAKVKLTASDGSIFYQEAYQSRGFQSSVDLVLHFGLGSLEQVDVAVTWSDQSKQSIWDVAVNQTLTIDYKEVVESLSEDVDDLENIFVLLDEQALGLNFVHQGAFFRDRIQSPLMPHTLSNLGPAMAVSDVNSDGLIDIFIGGVQDQSAVLYLQQSDGTFSKADIPVFEEHRTYEDIDAVFFDANGSGHSDLYVVSGGNFDPSNGPAYQDRLYLNDGLGNYIYYPDALPEMYSSGGTVAVLDIDGNNMPDLFIGGRVLSGRYPESPQSYLLQNNKGIFTDVTAKVAPELVNPGMVTDAAWADLDSDGQSELIIAGEWMPVRVFKNTGVVGKSMFTEVTNEMGLQHTSGWWNVIKVADLDGDGRPDLVAGNRGLNASLQAIPGNPVTLYLADFDRNGYDDPVITSVIDGNRYPVPDRDLFLKQLPGYKDKFPDYESWSKADISKVLSERQLKSARQFRVDTFASTVFINKGDGTFEPKPLPALAQVAPVYDMVIADFFKSGRLDVLAVGNNFGNRPEVGPMAGQGVLLKANGGFDYTPLTPDKTGFYGSGDIRQIEWIPTRLGPLFLLGRYGNAMMAYLYRLGNE
ncbi:VCBS repeat-containing protein [Aliifodinibius sp. S!AR15-10]|uniref:VCBS repeat-containing protein n=1 Tax=Aliifodinibius sp. S!AR15-10 TaxID=2950437 RepID=UPI0028549570|nr:VCBS repeat-containing protein [Aliifodinibius sp. S!AR15-10]MDR8394228.1 VCBS repeat-containing protein [Aliifodinibius sp. S!AR15-10]